MEKPFAPSCERNQEVILDALKSIIKPIDNNLLEIGSGTGQHAVYMAPHFPELFWHTSDLKENHAGINMWIDESNHENIVNPLEYQVGKTDFPMVNADVVFTTNTFHIMSWQNVQKLIKQLGKNLNNGADIIIYGPFNYDGQFTSKSNADFDVWLKQQNPLSGIRDFESILSLMIDSNMQLLADIKMPANNRILHFIKNKN